MYIYIDIFSCKMSIAKDVYSFLKGTFFEPWKQFWTFYLTKLIRYHGSDIRKESLSAWQKASFSTSAQGAVKIMILVTTKLVFPFSFINIRTIEYYKTQCVSPILYLPFNKFWGSRANSFSVPKSLHNYTISPLIRWCK